MKETSKSQVRLCAIFARESSTAVVFRRGPTKNVLLAKWNTADDTFELGQWFKGKIYERRCDLSPDGELLLYFAASFQKPYYSWSAVSKPPFLTALALWPKGDAWGGGGHFLRRGRIALNHRDGEMTLADGFSIPNWLKVTQYPGHPGWGEDDPVWSERLQRDGWKLTNYPRTTKDDYGAKVWMEYSPPITWQKPNPKWPKQYLLEMRITGIKEKDGPWYLTEHSVIRNRQGIDDVGKSDWADWSKDGDLLFAKGGCLFRVKCRGGILSHVSDAIALADLSKLKFEPKEPTDFARRWPGK